MTVAAPGGSHCKASGVRRMACGLTTGGVLRRLGVVAHGEGRFWNELTEATPFVGKQARRRETPESHPSRTGWAGAQVQPLRRGLLMILVWAQASLASPPRRRHSRTVDPLRRRRPPHRELGRHLRLERLGPADGHPGGADGRERRRVGSSVRVSGIRTAR
jgi:hypothetical protein